MRILLVTLGVALAPWIAAGQDAPTLRDLFEAGKHQEVVAAVAANPAATPEEVYLAGQAAERLNNRDQARELYSRLAARPEGDGWGHVGRAAVALVDGQLDAALAQATQATTVAGGLLEAHYQLGLVRGHQQAYGPAAAAFAQAAQINPDFAYAHYYAGLSYYRAKRIDLMANHFEAFLKLAPSAPERPEVESIMRTVRGR